VAGPARASAGAEIGQTDCPMRAMLRPGAADSPDARRHVRPSEAKMPLIRLSSVR